MIISWLEKSNSKRLSWQYLHFGLGRLDFPLYFRFLEIVCGFSFFFFYKYLQQLSMLLSTRQELRLNSFIACPGLFVVSLVALFLSLVLSLSLCLSACCLVFVWLLRLQLHASLTVNSRQAEHTFVPLSFTFLYLSLCLLPSVSVSLMKLTYLLIPWSLVPLLNSIGFHPICRICCLVRFFHFTCSSFRWNS